MHSQLLLNSTQVRQNRFLSETGKQKMNNRNNRRSEEDNLCKLLNFFPSFTQDN